MRHHAHFIRGRNQVERSADGSWNMLADSHDELADGGVDGAVDVGKAFPGPAFNCAEGEGEAASAPQFALQQGRGLGCSSSRCGMTRT